MLTGVKEIQGIMSHRHPFLPVDCIGELQPGVHTVGYRCVTYDESLFKGYFPQEPVTLGVLLAEVPAQTRVMVILPQEGFRRKVVYFGGIEKAKLKRKAVPGDRVKLGYEVIKQKGSVGVGKTTATVDGKLAVSTELTFMVG